MNQSEWEKRYSLKLVTRAVRKEFENFIKDMVPEHLRAFLSELYVRERMELSHVYGSWHKSHQRGVFPLQEVLDLQCVHFDEARQTLESIMILDPLQRARLEEACKSELPMIEEPKLITSNESNGRYEVGEHVMCGTPYARHDGDLCLDVFNFLARQPWKLRMAIPGTSKNLASLETYERHQKHILGLIGDNPVWLPWCCDSRGRMYVRSWWFNPQGDDAGKSNVILAEPRRVETREGQFALWADLGTSHGFDKLSWFQRAVKARKLFRKTPDEVIAECGTDDLNICERSWDACEKMVRGEPINHMVSLDATSSGMQIAACLVGDDGSMKYTNALDGGVRSDAYQVAYVKFLEHYGDAIKDISYVREDFKQALMTTAYGSIAVPDEIFRENVGLFFASMNRTFPGPMEVNDVLQRLFDKNALTHEWDLPDGFHVKVVSRKTFQYEQQTPAGPVFYEVEEVYKGQKDKGMAANTIHSLDAFILREVVRLCNYDDAMLNRVHSILTCNELTGMEPTSDSRRILSCWRNTGIASFRMFSVILDDPGICNEFTQEEKDTLMRMWSECEGRLIQVMSVHDCYRCHPDDAWIVRKYYRMILANITRGDFLSYMVKTLGKGNLKLMDFTRISKEDKAKLAESVMQSVYAIC